MKWLETPHDESERLLREGLDQATKRLGDEITHRRVWAKVAESLERPRPRVFGRLAFASAAAVCLIAAGVFGLPKLAHLLGSRGMSAGLVTKSTIPPTPTAARRAAEAREATATPTAPVTPVTPVTPIDQTALLESERVPGHVVRTRSGEHARVALGGGAEAELAQNSAMTWDNQHRPSIQDGSALLSVPHQPPGWRFSVTAGPYVVTVVGTKFAVRVASRTVGVEVTEGVVEIWRGSHSTRLVAGDSWNGPRYPDEAQTQPAAPLPAERPQPMSPPAARAAVPANRGLQDAQAALQTGDTNKAIEILVRTAQGGGPAAENAAYELGRITRYNLNRPRQAVALWDKYRTRFPAGLLRTEADLSIVDTLSSLGDVRAALAEADAFLARHPSSERRFEVQRLVERLRAAESAAGQR
jgi:transmembrane sensor